MPESLLKDLFPKWQSGTKRRYRKPASDSIRDMAGTAAALWERRWLRRASISALVVLLCAGGAAAYVHMRPTVAPDVFADDLADVLDYALLDESFNRLSVEERLALIKRLVERLKSMDSNDSALVAGFAAGIGGKARQQLQKNAEKLMVDVWDKFASQYSRVKPQDKEAFLDEKFVEMTEMLEDISGFELGVKPEQRVDMAREQAKRDQQRMAGASQRPVDPERVGNFFNWMNDRGQNLTTAEQRGRMAGFSRDMTRRLRGQDIRTGQPVQGPAPADPSGATPPGAVPPSGVSPPGANPGSPPPTGR